MDGAKEHLGTVFQLNSFLEFLYTFKIQVFNARQVYLTIAEYPTTFFFHRSKIDFMETFLGMYYCL